MNPFNPKRFAVSDGLGLSADRAGNAVVFVDGIKSEVEFFKPASPSSIALIRPLDVKTTGQVTPGTVQGAMPTIGGVALDNSTPPLLSLSGVGTEYVILNITGTASHTSLSGRSFFNPSLSGISVTITVSSTDPGSAGLINSTGSFQVLLAIFASGIKTLQNGYGPISLFVQDALDGSGNGTLQLTYS